jgi:hypothetical protein
MGGKYKSFACPNKNKHLLCGEFVNNQPPIAAKKYKSGVI